MGKRGDLNELVERIESLNRRIQIMEAKLEENKRFTFDEIRDILIKISNLEENQRKLNAEISDLKRKP
ncbi:MAG: hypothetical protein DRP54_01745 [Spirochaetes bacterium]|nr:MAG: hypothetical protein DRP54_01745 [Spirochaetota bacterium]